MNIKSFTFNPFQENTYIIYDETQDCIIIDPGCYTIEEEEELKNFIIKHSLNPVKLINTHCHIDHILGNQFTYKEWNLELHIHELELPLLKQGDEIAKIYGLEKYKSSPSPQYFLNEKETISFGNNEFTILFTPGHSPGHICLYNKTHNLLISGDVIFQNSIGRTDLPGGNYTTLINSINNKLLNLPEETKIIPGHGDYTNIKYEKKHNPFLNK